MFLEAKGENRHFHHLPYAGFSRLLKNTPHDIWWDEAADFANLAKPDPVYGVGEGQGSGKPLAPSPNKLFLHPVRRQVAYMVGEPAWPTRVSRRQGCPAGRSAGLGHT